MGAGIIPFSVKDHRVHFLFHKTFSGRREGFLVDFGGGCKEGEDYRQTAVREFVEETETMFFETDLSRAVRSEPRVKEQVGLCPEVQECHMVSGGFDYLIKVRASDMQDYRNFLGHELADIPNVRETHTYVVMQEVKVESSIALDT